MVQKGKNSQYKGNDCSKSSHGTDEFDDANLLNKSSKDKGKSFMNLLGEAIAWEANGFDP